MMSTLRDEFQSSSITLMQEQYRLNSVAGGIAMPVQLVDILWYPREAAWASAERKRDEPIPLY
jgi:hypothetical protein